MAIPNSRERNRLLTARGNPTVLIPPSTMRQDNRHLIELRRTPSGLGVFALRPFPRGTRILLEKPLLSIPDDSALPTASILTAFKSLPPARQALFLSLHRFADSVAKLAFAGDLDTPWARLDPLARDVLTTWCANALSTGVYVLGSRFNHACTPNTYTTQNAARGARSFHAIRDVRAGEELTISYIDHVYRHKEYRVGRLMKWDFECACVACGETKGAVQGEKKRLEISRLELVMVEMVKKGMWKEIMDVVVKKGDLQVQMGCLGWELGATCLEGARAHLMLGDIREAIKWARRVLEVNTRCAGADHPIVGQLKRVITRMESAWKRGGSLPVGDPVLKWFDEMCSAKRVDASRMSSGNPPEMGRSAVLATDASDSEQ